MNELEEIINFLKPYTKRTYLVGGAVRDILMNKTPTDFDIEIYDIETNEFEKLMQKLGAKGVGKSFFVYKYKNFDLSLPRTESKVSKGHKGFEVQICQNEKEAAKRRDFTMNSVMINIFTNEILDFYGGQNDIKNRLIRHIDDEKFQEDSLRVLRAMQFASRFKFKIAPKTIDLCKQIDLSDLSSDRIYKEFEKMFYSNYLYYGFYYFIKLEIAKKIFNLKINSTLFCKLSKIYKTNPHPSYFLYHLKNYKKFDFDFFPKHIKRPALMKKKPKKITNRFLMALSLKYPLKTWSILNNNCCKEWLIKNNLYEKKYKPKNIDPKNPKKSILQEIKKQKFDIINSKKDFN
jgi:tRNA nucleotidyltransferase (CCA-adding enzyme)